MYSQSFMAHFFLNYFLPLLSSSSETYGVIGMYTLACMFMIKLVSHGLFIILAHTCNYVLLNAPSIIRTGISIQGGPATASL